MADADALSTGGEKASTGREPLDHLQTLDALGKDRDPATWRILQHDPSATIAILRDKIAISQRKIAIGTPDGGSAGGEGGGDL